MDLKYNRPVVQLTPDGILIGIYFTLKDAAKELGATNGAIINACEERSVILNGYRWTYIGNYNYLYYS